METNGIEYKRQRRNRFKAKFKEVREQNATINYYAHEASDQVERTVVKEVLTGAVANLQGGAARQINQTSSSNIEMDYHGKIQSLSNLPMENDNNMSLESSTYVKAK